MLFFTLLEGKVILLYVFTVIKCCIILVRFVAFFNHLLITFDVFHNFCQPFSKLFKILFIQEYLVFDKLPIFKTLLAFRDGYIIIVRTSRFNIKKK